MKFSTQGTAVSPTSAPYTSMRSYRDSEAYRRSQKVDPRNGEAVWPLGFVDRPANPFQPEQPR